MVSGAILCLVSRIILTIFLADYFVLCVFLLKVFHLLGGSASKLATAESAILSCNSY